MAKYFGTIEDKDLEDLPEAVQKAIKDGSANADEVAALKAEIAEIKANPPQPKSVTPAPTTPTWNPPVTSDQELLCDTRMEQFLTNFRTGRDKMDAATVQLFESEIRENLMRSHPHNRSSQAYVKNILDLVKGRHMAEILADVRNEEKDRKFGAFTESGSSSAPVGDMKKSAAEQLTAEELQCAKQWGMTPEEFLESKNQVGAI